jgi:hypothetical protein
MNNIDAGQETEGGPYFYSGSNRPKAPTPGLGGGSDGAVRPPEPASNSVLCGVTPRDYIAEDNRRRG